MGIDRETLGFQPFDDLLLDIDIVFYDYRSHRIAHLSATKIKSQV